MDHCGDQMKYVVVAVSGEHEKHSVGEPIRKIQFEITTNIWRIILKWPLKKQRMWDKFIWLKIRTDDRKM
jgi:hypothetical protein